MGLGLGGAGITQTRTDMKKKFAVVLASLLLPAPAFANFTWTPLLDSSYFTGIRADLLVAVGGLITLFLIIAGVGLLIKVFR